MNPPKRLRLGSLRLRRQYAPPAPLAPVDYAVGPSRRHLLYYVYPVAGNSVWQCNIDQLVERIDLFIGRRVVAIARQDGLVHPKRERRGQRPKHTVDPPGAVQERLAGHGIDFLVVDNNQSVGEAAVFPLLLEAVSGFTGDVTFYGHAKGVTRPVNRGVSVHPWASMLYSACLDFWPVVEDQLSRFAITGAMKTLGKAVAYPGDFHYSGTFFWFKNDAAFARNWRDVPQFWGGVEAWPGVVFRAAEAGCLYWEEWVRPKVTGYDFPRLRGVLDGFAEWSEVNADKRRPGASPTPWLVRHGYG